MGMKKAFGSEADLTGIAKEKGLYLSDVIHKAYIDVNESGTEAAAASAIMTFGASLETRRPKEFRADHPFIFLVRDTEKGIILFAGRLEDPST
jgi:serpin B